MDVDDLTGKWAVVTGAASGIGRETALELGRRGASLAICDVDDAGLESTRKSLEALGRQVLAERVDVADREGMRSFAARVHETVPAVDLLVNNAGVGLGGGFLDTTLEDWDWIVGINLMGVVHGCHFFLPPMVRRGGGGHVVNISSAAGYLATETLVAYATTKFAVLGLSLGLRQELHRRGIGVTAVCPGLINTPITRTSRLRGDAARPGVRERMIRVYERRGYGPERVAQAILKAVARNRAVAPVTVEAWVMWFATRFFPGPTLWFNRRMNERFRRELNLAD